MQMIVVVGLITIVTAFGVVGISNARAEFRLQNAARLFASYVEKARADSIRRNAAPGAESSIETFGEGTTRYVVNMDWGSGTVEPRTFQLDSGLQFAVAPKKLTFDWRGRITEAWVFQIKSLRLDKNYPVDVSGSGDITVGEQHFPDQMIAAINISDVSGDVATPTPTPVDSPPNPDATPTPTPTPVPTPTPTPSNGNGSGGNNGNNGNGNGNPTPTPTPTPTPPPSDGNPTPTPTPALPQCLLTVSPSSLSLSQTNETNRTGTATLSVTNATGVRILSAAQAGNGNSLVVGLSLQRIDGNGTSVVSVTTKQGAGNRGVFMLEISTSPSCGSTQQLEVSVSN